MNLEAVYRVLLIIHCVFVTERILFLCIYMNELRFLEAHKKTFIAPLEAAAPTLGNAVLNCHSPSSYSYTLYKVSSPECVVIGVYGNKPMKSKVNLSLCLTN
jgi:hypothetical protein